MNILMLIATSAAAVATALAAFVSYLLFRNEVDPEVVVYAVADAEQPSMINLVIENLGRGMARNVRFRSSEPIPAALGPKKQITEGPLITGIPSLGPRAQRVLIWGEFNDLYAVIGSKTIVVTATFEVDPVGPFPPDVAKPNRLSRFSHFTPREQDSRIGSDKTLSRSRPSLSR